MTRRNERRLHLACVRELARASQCEPTVVFSRLLERHFALVPLGFLCLTAYFQARGLSRLVETAICRGAPVRVARTARSPIQRRNLADGIISRNAFDSLAGPLDLPTPMPKTPLTNTDPLSAPECDAPRAVIVTESRDRAWSVAALRATADAQPRNYRVGDQVAGKTVEFIGYNPRLGAPSVWLSSADGVCQTSLLASEPKASSTASRKVSATAELGESGTTTNLLGQVRIVPERRSGVVVGIRLFGVRQNSLLSVLGLENGDRIDSINGFTLGTPEQALSAYAHLRQASRLAVSVERHGKPVAISYHID